MEPSFERSKARPHLKIIDESRPRSFQPWSESRRMLAPLPVDIVPEVPKKLVTTIGVGRKGSDLPRLVPLDPSSFEGARQPWAVHRVVDLFQLFLPELSLTSAAVVVSGVLAGRMAQRFVSGIEAKWVLAVYAGLLVLDLACFYCAAKGRSYFVNKAHVRWRLLVSFAVFTPHLIAFMLLKAMR